MDMCGRIIQYFIVFNLCILRCEIMAYQRKTVEEWQLLGNYGYGFEVLTTEENRKGIKERLKEYKKNSPSGTYKTQCKRVKKEGKENE